MIELRSKRAARCGAAPSGSGASLARWLLAGAIALAGSSAPSATRAEETLDLARLLDEAERNNPELVAMRAKLEAARHVPSQAEALPDPTISVTYDNDGVDRISLGESIMTRLTLAWTQQMPFPGKRRLAGEAARAEADAVRDELEAATFRVRTGVKTAYTELYRLDRTLAILEESLQVVRSLRDAVRARYEAGQGSLENLLKAETEIGTLAAELEAVRQERRSAEFALHALLGRPAGGSVGPATLPPVGTIPEPEWAEEAALRNSPELERLRSIARREQTRLALARKSLKPDFVWAAGYSYRGGIDPMVMGMFGVQIPLYAKRKQWEGIAEQGFTAEASRKDVQVKEISVLAEVRDLLARARRAESVARLYEGGILARARSAFDAAREAYTAGRADFLAVLEDFRTLLALEVTLESLRAERLKALAALEPLVGSSLVEPAPAEGASSERTGDPHA
jgi:outer membrane protein TolC